jgi:hypothetical protein
MYGAISLTKNSMVINLLLKTHHSSVSSLLYFFDLSPKHTIWRKGGGAGAMCTSETKLQEKPNQVLATYI